MKNAKCGMNELRYGAIIAMAIGCSTLFAAGAADIVAKMPAKSPAEGQALAAELVKLGPAGIQEVCGMLTDPAAGDDSKARFALHGVAMQVMRPDAEPERVMFETALLDALAAAASPEVKAFLIEQLKYVAKNASVAPLSGFLADDRLCEPATQTLLVIRSPEAAAALAKALPDAKGKDLVTIVRALGELREKSVARAIVPHAGSDDATLRQTAWFALANIGDASAVGALAKAADSQGAYERTVGTRNYLLLAGRLAEAGDKDACARICRALAAARTGPRESNVVCAALSTLVGALGAGALPDVLPAVDSQDSKIRDTALQLLEKMEGAEALKQLVTRLQGAAPATRMTIVRMLGRRGDKAALPAVLQALKDDDKTVRLAAIPAVAALGGGDAIAPLLAMMDAGQPDEIQAAKEALMAIKAEGLAAAVGGAVAKAAPAAKATLLDLLGARGATDQVAVVLEAASDKDANVAMAALRALAAVVSAKEAPRLVDMLLAATEAAPRAELAKAVVAACRKADNPAAPVLAALPNAKGEARIELLKALARLGGSPALQAVLADAKSDDAALREAGLRALGEWCDASAAPALLGLARDAKETVPHVLALRGYLRLVALPNTRPPEQTADMFKQAMAAAQSADDKKLVLGGLSNVRHADAATLAGTCLDDDAVKTEAAAAVITIICPTDDGGKALEGPGLTELLAKAAAAAGSPALRKKAVDSLPAAVRAALPGDPNLALNKPVKASVGPEGNNVPEKAVDGNTDNNAAWFGQKWPCSLEVDLQKPEKIEAVHVFFYHDGGRYYQYTVEVSSDQKEYKKVVDMSKNTTPSNADGVLSKFEPVEARFVRLNITKHSANQAVHLTEIKVYPAGKVPAFAPGAPKADAAGPKAPLTPLAPPDKDGFIPLFNGKDLTGWTGSVKGYGAENGVIYCDPKSGGNLYTEHEFADFTFRFEFKLPPGANNGVGIRAPLQGDAAYGAMEIQILDDSSPQYAKLQPYQYHGSVYGLVAAKKGFQKPVGEWNEEEIQAIGRKIKITLNGTVIVDCDLDEVKKTAPPEDVKKHPGMDNRKGRIGWLGHGARVEFRNIRIKPVEPYTAGPHNVPPEGFTALFNGKDLTGWKGLVADPPKRAKMTPEALAAAEKKATEEALKHWKVEDGAIVYDGKNQSLCTAKDYGDFEMYVDWKIHAGGDSGIYIRGSPQVQIWQNPVGSGGLFNNQKNPSKPLKNVDNPPEQWNRFRIKMVGEKVWVWLNEELVVDNVTMENYWERSKPIYPAGQIELQHHGSTLWFRNIHIKELK